MMFLLQIFLDIFYFTHLYTSLQPHISPKLCKNCQHFIPCNPWLGIGNEYSKCALFHEIKKDEIYLVRPYTEKFLKELS